MSRGGNWTSFGEPIRYSIQILVRLSIFHNKFYSKLTAFLNTGVLKFEISQKLSRRGVQY